MGHLSVLKGAAPSLQQLDVVAPIASGESGITRGTLVYRDAATGYFKRSANNVASHGDIDTDGPSICWALHNQGDPDVKMAGGAMAAYPCNMPLELETSEYDAAQTYTIGQKLMAGAAGQLVPHVEGSTVIAIVTAVPSVRWINNMVAVAGERTGNRGNVIHVQTTYLPRHTTAV